MSDEGIGGNIVYRSTRYAMLLQHCQQFARAPVRASSEHQSRRPRSDGEESGFCPILIAHPYDLVVVEPGISFIACNNSAMLQKEAGASAFINGETMFVH
jgi:hypothetical protein